MTPSVHLGNLSHADQLDVQSSDGEARLNIAFDQPQPLVRLFRNRSLLEDQNQPIASPNSQQCILTTRLSPLGSHQLSSHSAGSAKHIVLFPDSSSQLIITPLPSSFTVSLTSSSRTLVQADIDLHPFSWYGLGHLMNHHWPLNESAMFLSPAYPFDNGPTGLSTVLDPTFLSSSGALVSIHDDCPCLHVAINSPAPFSSKLVSPFKWTSGIGNLNRAILPDSTPISEPRLLTLQSRNAFDHHHFEHPWSNHSESAETHPTLTLTLSTTENVKEALLTSLSNLRSTFGPAPCNQSKMNMMQYPIWSTWAQYKRDIDQEKVLTFASEIVDQGLSRSVMGIDDRWSSAYGELRFDPVKFPNPSKMVDQLHDLGFKVTLWVTPFADVNSSPLADSETRQYYVAMPDGEIGQFNWWQPGSAAALDVTNPKACEWFVGELQKLCDDCGIDGFKFDAGEPCFLPAGSRLHDKLNTPSDYTRGWIHNVASKFQFAEVRSAVRGCQSASPLFRIFDKYSTWGLQNGLASVLTAVLTSGILGFPFCIPDYIAGNAYLDEVPDAELMIRWTQTSAAMSALQFSIPPWNFDDKTCLSAVTDALRWREDLFWPHIKNCVVDASDKLWPIVRPMWWEEPELEDALKLYDQFMVGEDLVVAPIVVQGQRERAVFLPRGLWRKVNLSNCRGDGGEILGPVWLDGVPVPLDDMPVYMRVS